MKSIVLFCIFIILINSLKGQTTEPTVFISPPPSPTMSSLGIYANIPVDNFTGVPSIQVPLYTLKVKDMEVPISISYHASGIRVEQESSKVGLGWALNAGGIITRQIRGKDDFESCSYSGIFSEYNLNNKENLIFYDQHDNYRIIDPWYYDSNNNNVYTRNEDWYLFLSHMRDDYGGTDGEPDIFYVNFSEGAFKFIIDKPDNSVNSTDKYSIKILGNNNFHISIIDNDFSGASGFLITSQAGTKYYFTKVEYQRTKNGFSVDGKSSTIWEVVNSNRTRISGWYLTEIRDKVDNYITFEYSKDGDIQMKPSREQSVWNQPSAETGGSGDETDKWHLWKMTKINVDNINLKKITSSANNVEINFQYNADNYRLDKVTINSKIDNRHIVYSFTINSFGSASDRLKLEKVTKTSGNLNEDYNFHYYGDAGDPEEYTLPEMDSYEQDYWGYFNGAVDNNGLIPDNLLPWWAVEFFNPVMKFNADRNPNSECVKAGSLKNIEYPLGYSVSFEYELHQFTHPIRGEGNLFFPPACPDGLFYGGGLRVKKITYNDNGKELIKEYDYSDADGNYTSGELLRGGRLFFIHLVQGVPDKHYAYRTSGNLYASGFSAGGAHVGYSRVAVTEGNNTNKIKKVFNYYAVSEENFGTFSFSFQYFGEEITREYFVPNLLPVTEHRNGQLESEEWYKEGSNTPFKTINYNYLNKSTTISCYAILTESQMSFPMCVEYETILPNFVLEKKIITGPDILNTEETYTYNDYDLVTSVSKVESNGSKKKKEIIYNSDFTQNYNQSFSDDLSFLKLKEFNITNSVMEQRELVEKNGTTIISGASYLKYKSFNDKILPSEQYLLTNSTPSNIDKVSISTTNVFSKNPAYKLQYIFDAYDSYSNLLQMHKNDGNKTSYIWGYNGEYAVATINNACNNDAAIGIDCGYAGFESGVAGNNANNNYFENFETTTSEHKTGNCSSLWNSNHLWNFQRSFNVSNSDGKYIYSACVKVSSDYIDSKAVLIYNIQYANGTIISQVPTSFWPSSPIKKINGWQYVEIEIDLKAIRQTYNYPANPVRINVAMVNYQANNIIYVDDIRFHPSDAQMTTYTYDPLYGSVTSVTDANNKTTTYEYDAFGKLLRVRDFKGKLIKENLYNYKKYPIVLP